ncbi:hypothetical protein JB92DRAFT_3106894 [Gautieria morchelliformis]|nr:hypothetical protein JB92DRAFT_3106894 [Gautieria morchelliformis]
MSIGSDGSPPIEDSNVPWKVQSPIPIGMAEKCDPSSFVDQNAEELSLLTVVEIIEMLPEVLARKKALDNELSMKMQLDGEASKKRKREEDESFYESKQRLLWDFIDDNSKFLDPVDLRMQLERLGNFIDKT